MTKNENFWTTLQAPHFLSPVPLYPCFQELQNRKNLHTASLSLCQASNRELRDRVHSRSKKGRDHSSSECFVASEGNRDLFYSAIIEDMLRNIQGCDRHQVAMTENP